MRPTRVTLHPSRSGVTVLTSDFDTSAFAPRLDAALAAGCGGVVCSWLEIEAVRAARADFVTMVPGVRLGDGAHHDQARVGTPEQVAAAGASVLVIGRAVTAADDPRRVAAEIHAAVEHAGTG